MKKHSLYLLAAGFALLSNVALTSCDDNDDFSANDVLEVKSVLPTKVMEGQIITITGTGLDKATAVVFPGNVTVTDITKVGNGYITVVTPAGVSAEGGAVTVKANDESAESTMALTLGKPQVARVAPQDAEVKINECVEVYGSDLEFITCAHFPGANGEDIVVNAENFRRKSTNALYIYSPMGIAAGAASITIEDCSGAKTVLPEITLSDAVVGGGSEEGGEGYATVWEGDVYIYDWANWQYMSTDQFNLEGISLHEGLMMRLTFDNPDGASVCVCDAWWGEPNVTGDGANTIWVNGGTTQVEFPISEGMVNTFNTGEGIIIGGGNYTLKKIELFREYPTIWSGEVTVGWWWYSAPSDFDYSAVTPEAGQTIRFTFTPHEAPQTFCVCDGWWGAPFIRDGGESPNNVTIAADENFIEFEVSEGMAATMVGGDTALIIGGDVTITRIQIVTF